MDSQVSSVARPPALPRRPGTVTGSEMSATSGSPRTIQELPWKPRRQPIRLEDRENDDERKAWAHTVLVDRWEIVGEGPSAFVEWHIAITTWLGSRVEFWRRYSEFEMLRDELATDRRCKWLPELPPKNIPRFNRKMLDLRGDGLQYFMRCVLLDPVRARTQPVRRFCRRQEPKE